MHPRIFPIAVLSSLLASLVLGVPLVAAQATSTDPLLGNPCSTLGAAVVGGGGGANNMVIVDNATGGDLQVRESIQINHIPSPSVAPVNCASAISGEPGPLSPTVDRVACTGCQTFAVALQIDLIGRNVTTFGPRNVANAQNLHCSQCLTNAIAIQSVYQVDDPTQVPPEVSSLTQAVDTEVHAIQATPGVSPQAAGARIAAVVARYPQFVPGLNIQRSDAVDPTPSP